MKDNIIFKELSYSVIGVAMSVHNKLGCALPEHIYQKAMAIEFGKQGINCNLEKFYQVPYESEQLGRFFVDVIVEDKIILELKSDERLTLNHEAQLFTYLRISGIKVGYLINFGNRKLQFKRLIL